MRRSKSLLGKVLLFVIMTGGTAGAFYLGLVPGRLSPFAPLNLAERESWFLDFRLAALKRDASLCRVVLKEPVAAAAAIPDEPFQSGCGWRNAVHMTEAGGARISADKMTCELAAAFAMWMEHAVQPAAVKYLGSQVKSIRHMGVYACRNITGNPAWKSFRSQHASGNAIDVEAFNLADGRTVTISRHWQRPGAEADFLRSAHQGACRYFRVALGPNYNAAHTNHFHLDRGAYQSCR